jgi:hypothetical protein
MASRVLITVKIVHALHFERTLFLSNRLDSWCRAPPILFNIGLFSHSTDHQNDELRPIADANGATVVRSHVQHAESIEKPTRQRTRAPERGTDRESDGYIQSATDYVYSTHDKLSLSNCFSNPASSNLRTCNTK